jgi:hypothetical protein
MPELENKRGLSKRQQIMFLSKYLAILRYKTKAMHQAQAKENKVRYIPEEVTPKVSPVDTMMFQYGIPELILENAKVVD